jgi:hypothetical protein
MFFARGGGKDDVGHSGADFGLTQSPASRGNPRSLDQLLVALSIISSMEASSRSSFVAIDSCPVVQQTPRETLDLGLPSRTMATGSVVLSLVAIIF